MLFFSTLCLFRKNKDKDIEMEESTKQLPIKKEDVRNLPLGKRTRTKKRQTLGLL